MVSPFSCRADSSSKVSGLPVARLLSYFSGFVIYEHPQFVTWGKLSCQKIRLFSGIIHLLANRDLATLPRSKYSSKSPEQESTAVTLACWRLAQFSLFTLKRRKIKSSWMRCTAGYRVCLLVQRMVAASIKHEIFVCSLLECLGRFQNLIGIVLFRIRIQAAD